MSNSNNLRAQSANNAFAHAYGTEQYHRYSCGMLLTDGVVDLSMECKSFWLLDEIVSGQRNDDIKSLQNKGWKLKLIEGNSYNLTCDDGNGNVVFKKKITDCDFPYKNVTIWVEGNVILLPSEH